MAGNLFQNPKRALIFVAGTLVSVAVLVGPEGDEGALLTAADEIRREGQRTQYVPEIDSNRPDPIENRRERQTEYAFTPDEELIDDAQGFDPTPDWGEPVDTTPAIRDPDGDGEAVEIID